MFHIDDLYETSLEEEVGVILKNTRSAYCVNLLLWASFNSGPPLGRQSYISEHQFVLPASQLPT